MKPAPIMYRIWSSIPVPLTGEPTKMIRVLDLTKTGAERVTYSRNLNYDDVPLSFFKDDIEYQKKHGRDALLRRITDPDYREPKVPKDHKKRLHMQVDAAYKQLRKDARL
jgi:hypothetical protein